MKKQNNSLVNIQSNLPSPENFESYAQAVNRLPMLTEDEEKQLGLLWKNDNNIEAAKKLILSHLRLVVKIVREHMGYGYKNLSDLVQEGNIGLMKAVNKFDPEKDNRLSTYATIWIESAIREFLMNNLREIKIGGTPSLKKLFFNYRKTLDKLKSNEHTDRVVTDKEVAELLDVKESDVAVARSYFGGNEVSWDQENSETEDGFTLDGEASNSRDLALVDNYDNNPEDIVSNETDKSYKETLLLEAISLLDEREQDIIVSRRMNEDSMSLSQLSEKWGVSIERIRQIESEAVKKMAHYVQDKI